MGRVGSAESDLLGGGKGEAGGRGVSPRKLGQEGRAEMGPVGVGGPASWTLSPLSVGPEGVTSLPRFPGPVPLHQSDASQTGL